MTKQFSLSLSFETDQDVIDRLDSMGKGVRSNYIRTLIRADMNGQTLEDKIRKIVAEEISRGGNIDVGNALRNLFD